jgi:signal peptidase II
MTSERARITHRWLLPVIAAVIIVLDQLTKFWIREAMQVGDSIPVWGPFALTYAQNTGSAFGLFRDGGLIISIIGIIAVVLMLVFYRYLAPFNYLGMTALSMVFGGAVGNLIDRLTLGFVTDFIDVELWGGFHWPMFNVADSCISIGGILLIYFFIRMMAKGNEQAKPVPTPPAGTGFPPTRE